MKQLVKRTLLVCALASTLAAVSAAHAAALTVTPSGAYTMWSGVQSWRSPIGFAAAVCNRSSTSIPALSSTGSGTVPLGGATFSTCMMIGADPAIVTQSGVWTVAFVLTPFSVDLVVTLPPRGLTITGPRCTLTLTGTITERVYNSFLPVSINGFRGTTDTLRVDGNSGGGSCFLLPVGEVIDMEASMGLRPIAVVSG